MSRWIWVVSGGIAVIGWGLLRHGKSQQESSLTRIESALLERSDPRRFEPGMISDLPAPARRFLARSIAPGTPLARAVRLRMSGSMRLKRGAGLLPMKADQVLAPPRGFVWKAEVGKGLMSFSGFDRYFSGAGAMRWWLYGLLPIVGADGPDVSRSAAGRLAGEAFLVPSALLPLSGAVWTAGDDESAQVRISVDGEPVDVRVSVDPDGRLKRVSIRRWNGDAAIGPPGYLRFDVDQWSDERKFGGFSVQTRFRAGWKLGDPDEFPFFFASIESAEYF